MAPVAPHGMQVQQYEFVLAARLSKGRVAPGRTPFDTGSGDGSGRSYWRSQPKEPRAQEQPGRFQKPMPENRWIEFHGVHSRRVRAAVQTDRGAARRQGVAGGQCNVSAP